MSLLTLLFALGVMLMVSPLETAGIIIGIPIVLVSVSYLLGCYIVTVTEHFLER